MMKNLAKKAALLGMMLGAFVSARAFNFDADIAIQKAVNSPQITVKFKEARAHLIELRINGSSAATRTLVGSSAVHEMTFNVDLSMLEPGTNQIEVRLYAEDGTLLGTEKSTMELEQDAASVIEVAYPKQGESIKGIVEVKLGMHKNINKPYVSFMVDGQWKAIRNTEPYSYILDTESLVNGWHELEIWVVGEDNVTVKTRKVKVFVNNPGGRTDRITTPAVAAATNNMPAIPVRAMNTAITAVMSKPMGGKLPIPGRAPITTGARILTPTGTRLVNAPKVKVTAPRAGTLPKVGGTKAAPVAISIPPKVNPTTSAASSVRVTRGTRVQTSGPLTLTMNASVIKFDVTPSVVDGIPMSPFHHLYEHGGGKVKWDNTSKSVTATGYLSDIQLTIGSENALVNGKSMTMEYRAFLKRGRTIVPLSFIGESLNVNVDFDPATGHVYITKK